MNLTRQEVEFLMPGGKEEVFPFCRWSTKQLTYNVAVASEYNFFQDISTTAGQTAWWTNMRDPGKLERPYRAVFKQLYIRVVPALPDSVMQTPANVEAVMETTKRLHEMFYVVTRIIDKDYTEYPVDLVPSGGGPHGALSMADATTKIEGGFMSWGVPSMTNYAPISLILPTQTSFSVKLINVFPVAFTIPNVTDLNFYLRVAMAGLATRSEQ
jgi:hypothetical protein